MNEGNLLILKKGAVLVMILWLLGPLKLWVKIPFRWVLFNTTLCDKVCQWLAAGQWFSPGNRVFSTNKTDRHYITEILSIVALTVKHHYPNLHHDFWWTIDCKDNEWIITDIMHWVNELGQFIQWWRTNNRLLSTDKDCILV
jgi:hypothetical protein